MSTDSDLQMLPNIPLLRRLHAELDSYTSAERVVAAHILAHHTDIAFETAASLAERVGVSEITIGRFARKLRFRNFKALKNELKESSIHALPWPVGDELAELVETLGPSRERDRNCQREINALLAVYRLAETPGWAAAIELLARSRVVHVAGLQTERGIGMLLANRLQYVRPGVRVVDLGAGNYLDVFADDEDDACLVLIDVRRYSRQSYLLAEQAKEQGIPLIFLTDLSCDWASRFTPHVLAVPTLTGLFWTSPVALTCAVHLMTNDAIKRIEPDVSRRLARVTSLQSTFTGFVGHPPPKPKLG